MIKFYETIKIAIIGAGGFGREVYHHMLTDGYRNIELYDDFDEAYRSSKDIDCDQYRILVAIGDPVVRRSVVESLPKNAKFFTYVSTGATILDEDITIGEGSIICCGAILTTNITIGRHAHINLNTTIGHDCIIGDFLTTTPNVNISGNCIIGNKVNHGTNSSVRDKIHICDDVTVGLNSGIVKNITEGGVYIGTPAKKIK